MRVMRLRRRSTSRFSSCAHDRGTWEGHTTEPEGCVSKKGTEDSGSSGAHPHITTQACARGYTRRGGPRRRLSCETGWPCVWKQAGQSCVSHARKTNVCHSWCVRLPRCRPQTATLPALSLSVPAASRCAQRRAPETSTGHLISCRCVLLAPTAAAALPASPGALCPHPIAHVCTCVCVLSVTGGAGAAAAVEGAAPAHAFVPGSDTVPDWVIDAAIHGGASGDKHEPLSRGPHEGGKNCWSALDAAHFDLRGPTYLADSVKLPSIASAFRSVGVHAFKTSKPHHRAGHNIPALIEFLAAHPTQQFFLYNWLLPGSPCHNVVQVFVRHAGPDSVLDPLYQVRAGRTAFFQHFVHRYYTPVRHPP